MKLFTSLFLWLAFISVTHSQVGGVDLTFNPNDLGYGTGDGANAGIKCSAIQNDGKVIFGGWMTLYNANDRRGIVRVNVDGSIDTSFHIGTGAGGAALSPIYSLAIQTDGKIIILGDFTLFNGISRNKIARLNSDGSVDLSFNPGASNLTNNSSSCVVIQSDGKIIIGRQRFNSDGSIDNAFNIGSGINTDVLAIQSDGKIITRGANGVSRLNSDGSVDLSFNPCTGLTGGGILCLDIQSDGKIIIGGNFTSYNGTSINRLARLNTDGTLDVSFNPGSGVNKAINAIGIQSNGKIIIGGVFTTFNGTTQNYLARLNTDGSLDNSLKVAISASGNSSSPSINTIKIQNNDKIIIGGEILNINDLVRSNVARINNVTRINSDGTLDELYKGTGVTGLVIGNIINSASIQSDGKIIIGGAFNSYNGTTKINLARINTDGSIDNTFNSGFDVNGQIYAIAIQNDGKIIVGGSFSYYNGISRNNLARINSDGTLDASFDYIYNFTNGQIYAIAIQNDGKIIIGGNFTYSNNVNGINYQCKNIARFNSNGSLDATWVGSMTAGTKAISIQQDGKIIVGGGYSGGTNQKSIIRLTSNGSLDATFNSGTGTVGGVEDIKLQSDGKIIIVGTFTSYNGTTRNKIARLKVDGTLDLTFNPGTGADKTIFTTSIQNDGQIIIGGAFTSFNGFQKKKIARLSSNGSLDLTFDPGTGAESYSSWDVNVGPINTSIIQNDGKIIIGGVFTSYNGVGRNRIARIYGGEPCVISTTSITNNIYCAGASFNVSFSFTGNVYPGNIFTAQLSDPNGSFVTPTNIGSATSTSNGTILVTIPNYQAFGTTYRIRVVSSQSSYNGTDNGSNITINTVPMTPVSINGNNTVCNGTTNSYTINSINGATSYTWSLPNGWSGTSSSTSISATSGINNGNITVTANNSCGNSQSQSLAVIVNTVVPSTPGFINGNNSICNGSSNLYYISNISDATSYIWSLPSGWNGSSSNTSINATLCSTGGNITVTAINSCGNSAPQTLIVTVNPLPNVYAGTDQTICQGHTVTLSATGANTYNWNNTITNNVAFTPTSSNNYAVTGTDANGCQDSDTVHVTVNPTSSSQNTKTSNNNYVWNNQTYTQSGVYTQILQNKYGCDSTVTLNLTITSVNTTGIQKTLISKIKIYPNPANNNITIDYDGQIHKVEILDLKGAIVYTTNEPKNELNLPQNIQTGYYTVVIQTAEGIVRKELMIQK